MVKWYSGTLGPKVSRHLSYMWGKIPKKPDPGNVPTGDRTRARCVTGAHATTCPTAVDYLVVDVVCYLTTVMYYSYGQRPSPSVYGWYMVWMTYYGHMITGDECGPNFHDICLTIGSNRHWLFGAVALRISFRPNFLNINYLYYIWKHKRAWQLMNIAINRTEQTT